MCALRAHQRSVSQRATTRILVVATAVQLYSCVLVLHVQLYVGRILARIFILVDLATGLRQACTAARAASRILLARSTGAASCGGGGRALVGSFLPQYHNEFPARPVVRKGTHAVSRTTQVLDR